MADLQKSIADNLRRNGVPVDLSPLDCGALGVKLLDERLSFLLFCGVGGSPRRAANVARTSVRSVELLRIERRTELRLDLNLTNHKIELIAEK